MRLFFSPAPAWQKHISGAGSGAFLMDSFSFSEPLKLDPFLTLPDRVLPAPMEGVMTPVFCRAAMELGMVRTWMTPFVPVNRGGVPARSIFRKHLAPYLRNNPGYPVIVQLLGHDPGSLAEAGRCLRGLGVRAVNLNFACPSPTVLSSGNGGACLKDPVLMAEICTAVAEAVPDVSLSVKLRTGWESSSETGTLFKALQNTGISLLICHFRTVREAYAPVPAAEALTRLARAVDSAEGLPLFGNGDILTPEHAFLMRKKTCCAGVAVGRGMLQDPFLLNRIRSSGKAEEDPENPSGIVPRTAPEDRLVFLKTVYRLSREEGFGGRWLKTAFLQYARMTFGEDSSPEFRRILSMEQKELEDYLGYCGTDSES